MILVDTSVWIDYFNGKNNVQTRILDDALSGDTVLMGDIILCEILQGFDRRQDYNQARDALDILDCVALSSKRLAITSAMHFRFLRSKGITIRKTVDMLIGTWCIDTGIELLHNDKDFDRIAEHLPLNIKTTTQ